MGAQKTIHKRALSLVLAVIMAFGCTFITAPAGAEDVVDSDYVYVSTNLYKYTRTGNPMAINHAADLAAAAAAGTTTKTVRELTFGPYNWANSDWNKYSDNVTPGIVKKTLDANGNLEWAETTSYKYATADLFGSTQADASLYREDHTNLSFPLKKDTDDNGNFTGFYSFNSGGTKGQRATLDRTNNKINLDPQNISSSSAQFSPFYNGTVSTGKPGEPAVGTPTGTDADSLLFSFGMNMNMRFIIPSDGKALDPSTGTRVPMKFTFSGDDDVWVFVDGNLALDIGGIHQAKTGTIDFSTCQSKVETAPYASWGASKSDLQNGGMHTLTIYYLERGDGNSNFSMSCNLPQASSFEVGKQLEGDRASGDKGTYTFQAYYDSGDAYTALRNQKYSIYNINGGTYVKDSGTSEIGGFVLKSGQKAVFSYFDPTVKDTIAGKAIKVTEVGDVAEKYDTKWRTSIGQTTDHGDGKEAEITAPPDDDNSVQTASITFTNKLPSGISTPQKTATYTGGSTGKRTYDIQLSTSTKDDSTDFEYDPVTDLSTLTDGPTYYLDEFGNTAIHRITIPEVSHYEWYQNQGLTGTPVAITGTNPLYMISAKNAIYQDVRANTKGTYYILSSGSYYLLTSGANHNGYVQWQTKIGSTIYFYRYSQNGTIKKSTTSGSGYQNTTDSFCTLTSTATVTPTPPDAAGKNYYVKVTGSNNFISFVLVYPKTVIDEPAVPTWYDAGNTILTPQPTQVYEKVSNSATAAAPITATVQDTIDPRFEVVAADGTLLSNGAEIGTDDYGSKGILTVPDSGSASVVWNNQSIPVESHQWSQTIHVMAKPEFFGGNDIPTNVPDTSCVSYRVGGSSVTKPFTMPTVNVPILLPQTNLSETVFLGETVGAIPSGFLDLAAFNSSASPMWCGKDPTGTITGKWYYDQGCTQPAGGLDSSAITPLTPSDTTPYYYKVTYTPNPSTNGSISESTHGGPAIGTTFVTDTYTVNVVKGSLTITKTIAAPAAPDTAQFFTFKIERYAYDDTNLTGALLSTSYEVIYGSGSKTISNLPRGNYKVTEIPKSAWRYSPTAPVKYDPGQYLGRDGSTAAFKSAITAKVTNQISNPHWISGKDSVTNRLTIAA